MLKKLAAFLTAYVLAVMPAIAAQVPNPLSAVSDTTQNLGQFSVPTNAALRAISPANAALLGVITRQDFAAGNGAPPLKYSWKTTCPGTADNLVLWIKPTVGATGCWQATFPSSGVDVREAGAVGDNSTDNSTAFAAAELAAKSAQVPVFVPGGGAFLVTTCTTTYPGVEHRGAGQLFSVVNFTATDCAWKMQNPNGTASIKAPSWYDMTINTFSLGSSGIAIMLNSIAGGFTNDNTTQDYMNEPHIERVTFNEDGQLGIAYQCSKCFNGSFQDNSVLFFATAVDMEGSDVMRIAHNQMNAASTQEVLANEQDAGFGSELLVYHNDMAGLWPGGGGTAFIVSNYLSDYYEFNHMEHDTGTLTTGLVFNGGFSHTVFSNNIQLNTSRTASWITVNAPFVYLGLIGNSSAPGGSNPPANISGVKYWFNSGARAVLIAADAQPNLFDTAVPFNSVTGGSPVPAYYLPASQATLWEFNPNLPGLVFSNYGGSVVITNHAFALPALAAGGSEIVFQGATTLPNGIDIWVCGYTATSGQTITMLDGNSSPPTQVLTATNTCYQMRSNVNPTAGTIGVENADTADGGPAFITAVIVKQH